MAIQRDGVRIIRDRLRSFLNSATSGGRLEILFIGTLEPFPGGSGTVNGMLLRGLVKRGHRITAVSPTGPLPGLEASRSAPTQANEDDGHRFAGVQIHRYSVPYAEIEPHMTESSFVEVERAMIASTLGARTVRVPDVVLVGRETFARYIPDVLPWPERPPVVVIGHSSNAHGTLTNERASPATAELLSDLRACQRIVLVAEHQRRVWARIGVPMSVIPNGVDLDAFTPGAPAREAPLSKDDVVVIHVSNLKTVKRPLDLVAAASLALRSEPRLFFLVVGDGPLGEAARAAVDVAGIADRFHFAGWQPRARIPELLRQADVSVLMSEREAAPCALLESMASGLASIATDIPAVREVLGAGETGFTYPVGDIERLAELLVTLARDRDARQRVGQAARAAVNGRGVGRFIDGYEAVLSEVIAETSKRPLAAGRA